jgi:hypothetical protein
MRTWLWIVAAIVVVLGVSAFVFRESLGFMYLVFTSKPSAPFDRAAAPPAPDYSNDNNWAALPDRDDSADVVPEGVAAGNVDEREVDAFFIHPTTYYGRTWNSPIDDAPTRSRTDESTIRMQASAFNGCCRVYAPRYRQATLYAFIGGGTDEEQSTALAYEDVRAAFDEFLKRVDGRPFVIASHSQGSRYALWLLEDRIDTTVLRQRLVAAYVVGYAIPNEWFERRLKSIRPCKASNDYGCVLSWNTWAEGAMPVRAAEVRHRYGTTWEANGDKPVVCTNPLAWSSDAADASSNLGGWLYPADGPAPAPQPALTGARCESGALYVAPPEDDMWKRAVLPGGNYHNYDYQLFYMNVRDNAVERAASFMARWRQQGEKPVIWSQ